MSTKKFACSHCDKYFSRRDYLERHAANHLAVKPFVCHPCNRSFARSDLYENHLITKFHQKRANGDLLSSPKSVSPSSAAPPPIHTYHQKHHPYSVAPPPIGAIHKQHTHHHLPRKLSYTSIPPPTPSYFPPQQSPYYQPYLQTSPLDEHPNPHSHTPTPITISSPTSTTSQAFKHAWLFDEGRQDWGSGHYDKVYSVLCDQVAERAAAGTTHAAISAGSVPSSRRSPSLASSFLVGDSQARAVSLILELPTSLSSVLVSRYIDTCWTFALCSPDIYIHRPTFDADSQCTLLLAAMALVGMHYSYAEVVDSEHRQFAYQHSQQYGAPSFLQMTAALKKSLNSIVASARSLSDPGMIGYLQAYALFRWLLYRMKVTTTGLVSPRTVMQGLAKRNPQGDVYSFDGYHQHQHDSWRKWIEYESCKRSMYFLTYCEFVYAPEQELSVFDIDIHMPSPEHMWQAHTMDEFFTLVGPDRQIQCVPYLYVIRSMLRLPKLGEEMADSSNLLMSTSSSRSNSSSGLSNAGQVSTNWSLSALTMVLYGFMDIARDSSNSGSLARSSRGLQVWRSYFEAATTSIRAQDARSAKSNSSGAIFDTFDSNVTLLTLHYYAALSLVHEDIQLIKQFASVLPSWLASSSPSISSVVSIDRYTIWANSDEAKALVAVAAMFLLQAAELKKPSTLLSKATFYAVLILWLYQLFHRRSWAPAHSTLNVELTKAYLMKMKWGSYCLVTPPATPPSFELGDQLHERLASRHQPLDDVKGLVGVVQLGTSLLTGSPEHMDNVGILNRLLTKRAYVQ